MKKKIFKALKVAGIVLASLILLAVIAGAWFIINPWPKTSGNLSVKGLQSQVTVNRDEWGVPQIYADNSHDLFLAQGYVHAQDRLFQMEINKRLGTGTLSEVVGYPGLDTDKVSRIMGLRRIAEKSLPMVDESTKAILEAYCQGINAFIDDNKRSLPVEFTILGFKPSHWTPLDVLSWANMMAMNNGLNYEYELFRAQITAKLGDKLANEALPPWDKSNPLIVPKELEKYQWLNNEKITGVIDMEKAFPGSQTFGWASGAWVVSGKYTQTGKPLLASDVHMSLSMPSLWYENGLHGGGFDVTGYSLPGVPLVMIGHNSNIAWAFTNMNADVQDLYMEKLNDPQKPTQYQYKGKWENLIKKTEVIKIKGQEPVNLELLFTRHGPLMNDLVTVTDGDLQAVKNYQPTNGDWSALRRNRWEGAEPIALNWMVHDRCIVINSIHKLNLAGNWEEFRDALRDWDSLSQNFVYGDVKGNIGYQSAASVPIRVKAHQGTVPVPGWTGEYDWKGVIPFDELPSLYNPPTGYVAVVNNKTVGDDYPYNLSYDWFHPGYRARRVNEMLQELISKGDKISVEDMRVIQADNYSYADAALWPYVTAIKPGNELEAKAMEYIKKWNISFDNDSVGGAIFKVWYCYMDRNVFDDELQKANVWGNYYPLKRTEALVELIPDAKNAWFDDVSTPEVETRDDMISKSLTQAVEWLSGEYGKDVEKWTLGRIQTVNLQHQIFGYVPYLKDIFNSRKSLPFSGSPTSVAFAYSYRTPPGKFNIGFGANQRQIIPVGDWDDMQSVNSTGASGHIFNPHREDQMKLWADVKYHGMPFSKQEVEKEAEDVLVMKPEK